MINSRVNLPRPQGELLVVETSWSVHRLECRKVAPSDMAICQTLQGERHTRLRRDWPQEIRRTVPKLYIPSIDFFDQVRLLQILLNRPRDARSQDMYS